MRASFKKTAALLCAAVLAATALPTVGLASDNVPINDETFPEQGFQKYVSREFDTNKDGYLSEAERNAAEEIVIGIDTEGDLTGIEYFPAIKRLRYRHDGTETALHKLDLSKNTNLETLELFATRLKSLDLSQNKKLISITILEEQLTSQLTSLTLGEKPALRVLSCKGSRIEQIDLSGTTEKLAGLYLNDNRLTSLDLSSCPNVGPVEGYSWEEFDVDGNRLTCLDLSELTNNKLTGEFISLNYQKYFIEKTDDNTIDLTVLSDQYGFDIEKTSNWIGGTVDGMTLTLNDDATEVTYDYKCSDKFTMPCKLIPVSNTALSSSLFAPKWDAGKKTNINAKWFGFYGQKINPIYTTGNQNICSTVKYEIKLYCNGTSESNVFDSFVCENEEWWKSIKDYLEKETAPKSGTLYFSVQAKEAISYGKSSGSKFKEYFYEFTGNESEVCFSEPLAYNTVSIQTVSSVNIINATLKYTEGEAPVFTAEVAPADKYKYEITCESIQDVDKNDPDKVNGAVYSDNKDHGSTPKISKLTSDGNYYVGVTVKAKSGYKLADSVKITLNGITVKPESYPTKNGVLYATRCTKIAVTPTAHVHDLTEIPAVEPTYTSDGNIEYFKCSSCGKLFKDSGAVTEITLGDTVIPKLTVHVHIDADGDLICDTCGKITLTIIPGVVTDGGTAPSVADARMALRYAVGLDVPTATEKLACDTDFNKEVSVADARNILRVAVGLDTADIWELSKHL